MEQQIYMISAASETLSYKRHNPQAIHEEIFQHISDFIAKQNIKDHSTKLAMIAAASKAFELSRKSPVMTDKEILREIMKEIPSIMDSVKQEFQ